jgi:hypothetical protein
MLGAFWAAVGGKLADRWAAVAGPALVFWGGGVLAWASAGSTSERLSRITDWLNGENVATQVAVILGVLAVVLGSAVVVQRLTTPVLRRMEGYWPNWAGRAARRLCARIRARAAADDAAWQRLRLALEQTATELATLEARTDGAELQTLVTDMVEQRAGQLSELAALEQRRRHRPSVPERLLPTRIGNILRAAETRPFDYYGLEAVIVWPRLWLVLPETARQQLGAARATLDSSVAAVIWGIAFCSFAPVAWWAVPVGIGVAAAGWHWWVPSRAEVFADLVDATFDLYRSVLYRQLRWPLPTNPAEEHTSGEDLAKYLLRGSIARTPEFTAPE